MVLLWAEDGGTEEIFLNTDEDGQMDQLLHGRILHSEQRDEINGGRGSVHMNSHLFSAVASVIFGVQEMQLPRWK